MNLKNIPAYELVMQQDIPDYTVGRLSAAA